jgi:hypothetical protein
VDRRKGIMHTTPTGKIEIVTYLGNDLAIEVLKHAKLYHLTDSSMVAVLVRMGLDAIDSGLLGAPPINEYRQRDAEGKHALRSRT